MIQTNNHTLTIYTHYIPRHLDDFIALSILIDFLRKEKINYELKYISYEEGRIKVQDKKDYEIFVDVGHQLDLERGLLDHHQNLDIPASNILVLEYLYHITKNSKYLKLKESKILGYVDYNDRFGPKVATERFGIEFNVELGKKIGGLINQLDVEDKAEDITSTLEETILENDNFKEFIDRLWNKFYPEIAEKIKKYNEETTKTIKELKESINILIFRGLKIGISTKCISKGIQFLFQKESEGGMELDILIAPNLREPDKLQISRNSFSKLALERVKLEKLQYDLDYNHRISYLHPGKFTIILNIPFDENFSVSELIKILNRIIDQ